MPGKFFLFKYEPDDIVVMKKKHPCGSREWRLTRVGMECKLTCTGCGRTMTMDRPTLEKATVEVKRENSEDKGE